ncbi:MAG: AraC family transcriptional regulator ligand-binding domain-containing protein [Bacteroidota bacterium]
MVDDKVVGELSMKKYVLEMGWQAKAQDMEISLQDVLHHAQLPPDLLTRTPPTVTADEYLRLWRGIEYVMKDTPAFPLHLGESISPETFSPTLFACLYSRNLKNAFKRIAKYKPFSVHSKHGQDKHPNILVWVFKKNELRLF